MPNSLTSVRCFTLALAISAFAGSVAGAQVVPRSRGEGMYTGDLTGPMIVTVNDRYGRTGLWVDGVLYGGSVKHPGTGNAIGFDHQFLAGGVNITTEPFESGEFETTEESTWGHVMRFQGTITNDVASGTWSLDYNEDSNDCRTASENNRSCTTRTGTFEVPLTPLGPLNTVQPLDFGSVCGAIGPLMASLSLLGIGTVVATRRRRRR